jgi:hypothetical protein
MKCTSAQCADGPLPFASGFEVKRHFAGDGGFASSKESFQLLGDTDVTLGAPVCCLPLVENFTIELVREGLEIGTRVVGEIVVACPTNQACSAFEVIAELFDGFGIFFEDCGCSPNRKGDVHETAGFENPLFLRGETIDFQLDESREFVRNADVEIGA